MEVMSKAELKKLEVGQLEDYRNQIAKQEAALRDSFRAAGEIKAAKIAASPRAIAMAKIAEGREELAAQAAEEGD
jgi:hypothetical protein